MTGLAELLADCEARGIRLLPSGDGGLTIDAPRQAVTPDLLDRLTAHKADLLANLRPVPVAGRDCVFDPEHRLADFNWDSSRGYCPCRPVVRGGVRHKLETCAGLRSWRHVWGKRYCSDCWPCTDPLAIANDDD